MGRITIRAAWPVAAALTALFAVAGPAAAQNIILDSSDFVAPIPATPGSGLDGTYSNGGNPIATFNAPSVCYPDCAQTLFDTPLGGLLDFTNDTITNLNIINGPLPQNFATSTLALSGFIAIPNSGSYVFSLFSGGTADLAVGNTGFLTSSCCAVESGTATFTTAGLFSIVIGYVGDAADAALDLVVTDASTGVCITGCADGGPAIDTGTLYSAEDLQQLEGAPLPPVGAGLPGLAVLALAGAKVLRRRLVRG